MEAAKKEQLMVQFIPAEKLKSRYDVFGHFYSVEVEPNKVVDCRSVLEIVEKTHAPEKMSLLSKRFCNRQFFGVRLRPNRNDRIHRRFSSIRPLV